MEHIVIIGNGISGVTLARHIRKNSDKKITIVSAETEYFFFQNRFDVRIYGAYEI